MMHHLRQWIAGPEPDHDAIAARIRYELRVDALDSALERRKRYRNTLQAAARAREARKIHERYVNDALIRGRGSLD